MIRLFKTRPRQNPLQVDIHSHLLPGLDDGVKTLDESLRIIQRFEATGYRKVITTPHIMGDFYQNTEDEIRATHAEVVSYIDGKTSVSLMVAAEYYLDESLILGLDTRPTSLLTMANEYLLFETSFMNEPIFLKDAIFKIQSSGMKPVLAHPERYAYLHNNWDLTVELIERGVLFQLNLNSLVGFYSKPVLTMAKKLVKNNFVHFLGSDCHNEAHMDVVEKSLGSKLFEKATGAALLNNTLL